MRQHAGSRQNGKAGPGGCAAVAIVGEDDTRGASHRQQQLRRVVCLQRFAPRAPRNPPGQPSRQRQDQQQVEQDRQQLVFEIHGGWL